ncbi:MAG: UDP-3-O-(3-hydroxymyristoyl)glucosamine N-acyltransferase [Deltaproteobacteria bacterium]|nr:UDP-3-O-(3-hydroxymyristoyl)glucosamine N-acyltransferase [Deltaproteobacteria bacterium]
MAVIRLDRLASIVNGRVVGDGSVEISDAASIEHAGAGHITFLGSRRAAKLLKSCRASAVILQEADLSGLLRDGTKNFIIADNPHLAFAKALEVLRPGKLPAPGIHPSAFIHPAAVIGKDASVGACTVVEKNAAVGERTVIYPGAYIGEGARIGEGSVIHAGVCVREGCIVGNRVIIHCNSVIGSDGFGYAKDGSGYYKIPQTGIVRIEDDCEIGACTAIDRATLGETVIGKGTKLDNLVQIAHNVRVGEDTVMAAQTGIAGSTTIGNRVRFGGQSGAIGHINIGDGSTVGAKTAVMGDIAEGSVVSGSPAAPHNGWLRAQALFLRLPELKKRLDELEKRLAAIAAAQGGDK